MKNQLVTLLTIASFALIIQSCKKEDLSTLNTSNNNTPNEQPQSQTIQNFDNSTNYNKVEITDLAGAMTPQNYPLDSFQLLVQTAAPTTNDDTTKKIRRGLIVTLGRGVSTNYVVNMAVDYDYTNAIAVYISGNYYNKISESMILVESPIVE